MRMQRPSTSATTLWATSVKALACWLEPALLKKKTTSDGKFRHGLSCCDMGLLYSLRMFQYNRDGNNSYKT